MNIRHYILRLLLVFVCLFALFSHSLTVYASDYDPTYYFLAKECGFSSFAKKGHDFEAAEYNWWDFVSYEAGDGDYGYGFSPGPYILGVWQTFDRPIKAGTYDLTFKISMLPGCSPEGIDWDRIRIRAVMPNEYYGNYIEASSFKYNKAVGDNPAYLLVTYHDFPIDENITQFLHLFYVNLSAVTAEDDCAIHFQFTSTTFDLVDETPTLLNGIVGWVKNIFNSITELPKNIANSIKGFFDNIVNAVVNLGNTLLEGIKNLFIPSEEDITNMKDKWDTLLSDRFGALYQVAGLISDYAASFKEQSKNTITFPSISIPLADATFEFGGWEVQVVPDGFRIIFDTLKMITSILATMLFINGLKNRFDKIMGGADDI